MVVYWALNLAEQLVAWTGDCLAVHWGTPMAAYLVLSSVVPMACWKAENLAARWAAKMADTTVLSSAAHSVWQTVV